MTNLDDPSIYPRLDPSGMWQRIAALPAQVRQAWEEALALKLPDDYAQVDKVVLAGMGGSAVGGDLLADLLALEAGGPVFVVCRDYRLPRWVDQRTLVIVCSYSGHTEETLSCFQEALKRSARVVAITSGGRLLKEAVARDLPHLVIRYQGEPRTALGFSFVAPLALLQKLGLVSDKGQDVEESLVLLESTTHRFAPDQPTQENPTKGLAEALAGRLIVVYGAGFLTGVARRWKTQMNENAKAWAFAEALPELNHNSVAGYQFPHGTAERTCVVLLSSSLLHPQTAARYPLTVELLEKAGVAHCLIEAEGTGPLGQMLTTICRGDWTSYYLALLNGVDPSPVAALDGLKRRLGPL